MEEIKAQQKKLASSYKKKQATLDEIQALTQSCLSKLNKENYIRYDATCDKDYCVYKVGSTLSRPFLPELMISCRDEFELQWRHLVSRIDSQSYSINSSAQQINKTLYTSIMAIALCYDLWAPKSRKTPGTFFEILLGSVLDKILIDYTRQGFISIPNSDQKVTTDIAFNKGNHGLAIPAKISTRERIVQPYAHQRILDAVFGKGRYNSILLSVSETQRDDKKLSTNDICVPGTIKLFEEHIAHMGGLYYLDPPERYLSDDLSEVVTVASIGELLSCDLAKLCD